MISVLTQRALKLAALKTVQGRKRLLGKRVAEPEIYYFGYGANLDIARFKKYSMNVKKIGKAFLPDHRLNFSLPCEYLGKGFASADPEKSTAVWGVLYKIDRLSLFLLDVMEWAVLNQYKRVSATVTLSNSKETVRAEFYSAKYPKKNLKPSTQYRNIIVEAARKEKLPNDYFEEIAAHPAQDHFELDPGFSFIMPDRRRFFEKQLRSLYLEHDRLREKVCDWLRF